MRKKILFDKEKMRSNLFRARKIAAANGNTLESQPEHLPQCASVREEPVVKDDGNGDVDVKGESD